MEIIPRKKFEKIFNASFYGGLIFKAGIGFFEVLSGIILWFTSIDILKQFSLILTNHELLEDPGDILANWVTDAASNLSLSTKNFITLYLIAHGVIKLVLVTFLFRKKMWSYPTAVTLLLIAIVFQSIRILEHRSAVLIALTLIDVIILAIIWREYLKIKGGIKNNYEG